MKTCLTRLWRGCHASMLLNIHVYCTHATELWCVYGMDATYIFIVANERTNERTSGNERTNERECL